MDSDQEKIGVKNGISTRETSMVSQDRGDTLFDRLLNHLACVCCDYVADIIFMMELPDRFFIIPSRDHAAEKAYLEFIDKVKRKMGGNIFGESVSELTEKIQAQIDAGFKEITNANPHQIRTKEKPEASEGF